MENPTGKSISELVKEAEAQGAQLLIVGHGNDEMKKAEMIAKIQSKQKVLVVPIEDLSEEDQKKLDTELEKPKQNPFERPPLPITDTYKMGTHEVFIQDEKKTFFGGFDKRKKLKGYQKGRR